MSPPKTLTIGRINNVTSIPAEFDSFGNPTGLEAKPWYLRMQFAEVAGIDIDNRFFIQSFTMLALQDGKTFTTTQFEGLVTGGTEKIQELLEVALADRGGFVAAQYLPFSETSDYRNWQYFWNEGVVTVTYNDDDASVTIFALNKADRDAIVEAIRPHTSKKRSSGKAYVMVNTSNGIQLKAVSGSAKVAFEQDNYSEDTATKYHYMVNQLKSDTPNGRIMIFRGKPGGGKTYLIRSLVGAVDRAIFVVVPAAMVSELDGPNILGTLINTHSNSDGPIVIILEDADSVLAPRGGDNMHSISSLLNISDGILGNLMDLRIIATTNALKEELDEAVVRDGRLCVDIEVGSLPFDQSQRILRRLTKDESAVLPEEREYQLAEIYKLARPDTDEKIGKTQVKRSSMGFDTGPAFGEEPKKERIQSETVLSYEQVAAQMGEDFAKDVQAGHVQVVVDGDELDFVAGNPGPAYSPGVGDAQRFNGVNDALENESDIEPNPLDDKGSN